MTGVCVFCVEKESIEYLVYPANSKRSDIGAGYELLALNLSQLQQLEVKPFDIDVSDLGYGEGVVSNLSISKACWHKACRYKINSTEITEEQQKERTTVKRSVQAYGRVQ